MKELIFENISENGTSLPSKLTVSELVDYIHNNNYIVMLSTDGPVGTLSSIMINSVKDTSIWEEYLITDSKYKKLDLSVPFSILFGLDEVYQHVDEYGKFHINKIN